MKLPEELTFAIDLARSAAKLVAEKYGKVPRLTKRHAEAVTDADRASQRLIIAALAKRFPGDGIVGEENETGDAITFQVRDPMGRNWVIDPIDGTNNFIARLPLFAVCIGLLDGGMPVLGVVHDVTRRHSYLCRSRPWRVPGFPGANGSEYADERDVDDHDDLESARWRKETPAFASRWLNQTTWKIRILGSAAIEAAQVAAGVAHAAVTLNGKLWDIAAPAAIVLEAGGVVTDLSGKNVFPFDLRNYAGTKVPFLAASASAHAQLIKEIAT